MLLLFVSLTLTSSLSGFLRNSMWVKSALRWCGCCLLRTWNMPWRVRLCVCVCVCILYVCVSVCQTVLLLFFPSIFTLPFLHSTNSLSSFLPLSLPVLHKIDHYRWNNGEITDKDNVADDKMQSEESVVMQRLYCCLVYLSKIRSQKSTFWSNLFGSRCQWTADLLIKNWK